MSLPAPFPRVQRACGLAGCAVLAACALYGFFFPASFFQGYLVAFVFWTEIALGCLAMLFVQNLTGGLWGMAASRFLEAGMMTLPICGLLFVPILFGMPYLYPWVHPTTSEMHKILAEKGAYLNVPFYVIRNILYFSLLSGIAFYLRRLSRLQDVRQSFATERMAAISGPSLVLLVLLMDFASTDWVMALRPIWYSSMLVVEFVAEQGVAAIAFSILLVRCTAHLSPLREVLNEKIVHDLGKLLLASVSFWAYVTFGEYIIIWTGNLPHEISWFLDRSTPGWIAWVVFLIGIHFVIPLFFLIMTSVTKNLERLSKVAALVLFAHLAQTIWWIEPGFTDHFYIHWTSLVLTIALGGIWMAIYLCNLGAAPLLPLHDPRLVEQKAVPA